MSEQPRIAPDDLLTLLAVARLGKYTATATALGVNHTTISRRIASLEKAVGDRVLTPGPHGWELTLAGRRLLGPAEGVEAAIEAARNVKALPDDQLYGLVRLSAPEGFMAFLGLRVLVDIQKEYPGVHIDLHTVTQQASRHRSGMDLEVVVGKPEASNVVARGLSKYQLALFASTEYLRVHGTPERLCDLESHRLVYYPDNSLAVNGLNDATTGLPVPAGFFHSNSLRLQLDATRAGVGVGLLPDFAAEGLVRVIPRFAKPLRYWLVARPEVLRRPVVAHVAERITASA